MVMNFSDFGILVNQPGSNQQKVSCPKCNKKNKNLSVNIEKGIWNCHSANCGWTGSLTIKEIAPMIKKFKKPVFREQSFEEKTAGHLEARGISIDTQTKYNVSHEKAFMPQTSQEENCIVFPYFIGGDLINRKYRDGKKNMKMESECRLVMYNPVKDQQAKSVRRIYITEGEIDALTLLECGLDHVTSVPNGAPSTNTDIEKVDFDYIDSIYEIYYDFNEIVLVMDADEVGIRFRDELARRFGFEICKKVSYPEDCKDINDVLVKHGIDKVAECIKEAEDYPVKGLYDVDSFQSSIMDYYKNGFLPGVSTGWPGVNKIYSPRTKEFTVVTGIPSHGKSVWLDNLMINVAKHHNWKFAVFSPENAPCERHIANLTEITVGKPFGRNYNGHMSEKEMLDAQVALTNHFYFLLPETDSPTIDEVLRLSKAAIFKHGVRGIVIDPWNEIEHNRGSVSETDYISKALSKIRYFCRMNDVHIWLVAHPFKMKKIDKGPNAGNYPVPTPYDISGSAHWRNKADNCVCVYRDFEEKITKIYTQKIRFKECGEVGEAVLKFDVKNSRFSE